PIPVIITIYADRSFTFEMKTPPMSYFLKQAAKIQSGSKAPGRDKAGKVTKAQVREIAETKMKDLNCDTVEAAMKLGEGSVRSMGLEVAGRGRHEHRKAFEEGSRRRRSRKDVFAH